MTWNEINVIGDGEILKKKRWKQDRDCWVILVHIPDNEATPFVRWIIGPDHGKYWGRYYADKNDAIACYDATN